MIGIKQFTIKKHGKDRIITTYDDTSDGIKLRCIHESFLNMLNNKDKNGNNKFESSIYSFAYKKGICTVDAFENHKHSIIFIKLDIHNFFESLTKNKFKKYYPYFKNNLNSMDAFESCFVDDHLAIGFVPSPKLSDIFMYDFDLEIEKYLNKNPNLKYSRYCDDILISSIDSNFIPLRDFKNYIINKLKKINFEINNDKTKEYDLRHDTSVSFLGLNMSLDKNENRITVSKTIILKPINLYTKYRYILSSYEKAKGDEKNKLKSKLAWKKSLILSYVNYINTVSKDYSFPRFTKKFKNKFKIEWNKNLLDF